MAFADFSKKPNLMILITDQQSAAPHWPDGWAEANLPAMERLKRHGLTFTRAYTNSCTCSPSRATLFTGLYPAQHGVTQVLEFDGAKPETERIQVILPSRIQNLAKILRTAGYDVVLKGKWHLTKPTSFVESLGQIYWSEPDVGHIAGRWGFAGWSYPDAGDNNDLANMGGGSVNNDGRYIDGQGQSAKYGDSIPLDVRERASVLHFLETYDGARPFCLIVSLVNPHDVLGYPGLGTNPAYQQAGYDPADFEDLPIDPPDTVDEDLSTKPTAQTIYRRISQAAGVIGKRQRDRQRDYVRFYAYLIRWVDLEILKVLDALGASGRTEDTVIVRLSDHGDMDMAHGRQRQKMYNVYQETLNVPLIVSNPRLFPEPRATGSLVSLVDVLPTLATIAGVPERDRWTFKGKDLTPILEDPRAEVQDCVHFTYDDTYFWVDAPNRIRCLTEHDWKYALYYNPLSDQAIQYEMYHLAEDPLESRNLTHPQYYRPEIEPERRRLHHKLTALMEELGTTPGEIIWPAAADFDPEVSYPDSGAADTDDDEAEEETSS
jgi:arylsulfatase A-like enzyme